jgi:hypothetical protein
MLIRILFKQKMGLMKATLLFLIIHLLNNIQCLIVFDDDNNFLVANGTQPTSMYSVGQGWTKSNCSCLNIKTKEEHKIDSSFSFIYSNNDSQILDVYSNNQRHPVYYKTFNTTWNLYFLDILHTCQTGIDPDIPVNFTRGKYESSGKTSQNYDIITVKFFDGEKEGYFQYLKVCQQGSNYVRLISALCFAFLITFIFYLTTISNINMDNVLRGFNGRILIGNAIFYLIFAFFISDIGIAEHILLGMCYMIALGINLQFFKAMGVKYLNRQNNNFINITLFYDITPLQIFISCFTIFMLLVWNYSNYHWIINNYFAFFLIFYWSFIIRYENLKFILFYLLIFVGTIIVCVLIFASPKGGKALLNAHGNNFPVNFSFPIYFYDMPGSSCFFTSYNDMFMTAFFLRFCKKIDQILYINFYYKLCLGLIALYLTFMSVYASFFNFEMFGVIPSILLCLVCIPLVAYKKGDLIYLWRGKVLPGENLKIQVMNVISIEKDSEV